VFLLGLGAGAPPRLSPPPNALPSRRPLVPPPGQNPTLRAPPTPPRSLLWSAPPCSRLPSPCNGQTWSEYRSPDRASQRQRNRCGVMRALRRLNRSNPPLVI